MRTTYENAAKILARFGAGLQHVVDEVRYVIDTDAAFAVAVLFARPRTVPRRLSAPARSFK